MSIAKQEQHRLEQTVFACRAEAGLQALRTLLLERQENLNRRWPTLAGDELVAAQGEAQAVNKALDLIDIGPRINDTNGGA